MPTTRAMARKGSSASEDKENEMRLALRKKPVRRATAKSVANKPVSSKSQGEPNVRPLSPIKVQQVAKGRGTGRVEKRTDSTTSATASAPPRRPNRAANTPARRAPVPIAITTQSYEPEDAELEESQNVQTTSANTVEPEERASPVSGAEAKSTAQVGSSPGRPDDESDDELCGPKTPMRRQTTAGLPSTASKNRIGTPPTTRQLKTPAKRLAILGTNRGTPQTQHVPLRPAAISSPQRLMTVARKSSVASVFHPLPTRTRTTARDTLEKTLPVREAEGPSIDANAHESASLPLSNRSPIINRTPLTIDRRRQLERARQELDQDSATDEEPSTSENECAEIDVHLEADPTFDPTPGDEIVTSDDDVGEDGNTVLEDDCPMEPITLHAPSPVYIDSSDEEDATELAPEVDSELLHTSPAHAPPVTTLDALEPSFSEEMSSPLSHALYSPAQDEEDVEDSVIHTPYLPVSRSSLIASPGRHMHATPTMPSATPARLQFNMKADRPFKTPRMQSALDEFERRQSEQSTPIFASAAGLDRTVCIDPSLLALQGKSPPVITPGAYGTFDDLHMSQAWDRQSQDTPPFSEWNALQGKAPRLSVLPQDEMFYLAEPEVEQSTEQGNESTTQDSDQSTEASATPTLPVAQPDVQAQVAEDEDVPGYAKSTIAFDARRKSMPSFGPDTPQKPDARPHTAGTVVKPFNSDIFAARWAETKVALKQAMEAQPARRNTHVSSQYSTPKAARAATPSSIRPAQRLLRQASMHSLRHSTFITPSTPRGDSNAPRPRSYTPTFPLSRRGTPAASSPKELRSPAKRAATPRRSPVKTPLRPAGTPAAYPYTPHPAQPLRAVVALVEIFTLDGSDASRSFVASLHRLGARTTKSWSERVTHVVFKDGSPTTLQKVRLANKEAAGGRGVFCVNSRWVTDCDREGARMDEGSGEYAVDTADVPRGGQRRRKSMEPAALKNVDGNVMALSARKTPSLARVSLASTAWGSSPVKTASATPGSADEAEDENDDSPCLGAAATPQVQGYSIEEDSLLQRTAPVHKMKRLKLPGIKGASRRLTSWDPK